ncbi:hypothetical protein ACIGXM_22495 [Kitasatospora sp. NPDC052896]|uniref:hypothetical protein n=1 Tax=Kitasatospora sp. NPDC052896 TaxID=3364061 RepID=UPI0037C88EE4
MCALLTGVAVLPATAAPVTARSANGVPAAAPVIRTFTFTGAPETYTVPAGTAVTITADGAGGGDLTACNTFFNQPGGTGGRVATTLVTTALTTYTVNVGGAGGKDCGGPADGGYGGGGPGGPDVGDRHLGAGGGGASTVSTAGALQVVAGGGGGAGNGEEYLLPFPSSGGRGGNGGLNANNGGRGSYFSAPFISSSPGDGGVGGSTTARSSGSGGAGGSVPAQHCTAEAGKAGSGFSGTAVGTGGAGGRGADNYAPDLCVGGKGGGGGGGGYFGGGGGGGSAEPIYNILGITLPLEATGGGGGGGSSFATPSGTNTSYTTSSIGTANNNGQVTISYTAAPDAITATAGTPQSTHIGTFFRVPFQATVTDALGHPVSGVQVTFAAPRTGPSGTFGGTQTSVTETTNANGVATAPTFTANNTVGSYTLTASLPGEPSVPPAPFALTNLPSSTGPFLTISKHHAGNFTQGQQGVYTITVGNAIGAGPTTNAEVDVFDVLPPGLTAASANGSGWTCTLTGGMTCTRRGGSLPAGQSYPDITLTVDVSPTAPAQVINTATTIGGGDTTTHAASDPTTINPKPSLTISKHHAGNFTQGQQGTYTITVGDASDAGQTDGSTVTVKDLLPTGLSAAGIGGPGWTCDPGTVTCTRSDVLSAGQSYPDITLTVDVSPSAPAQVTNTVTATGGGDTTTHTATDPTTVNPPSSLTISKHHTGNFVRGEQGTYTITVGNNGPGPTDGSTVIVKDLLPTGLSAAGIGGPGWTCDPGTVTCTRSDVLSAGQSYPDITLTVDVSPTAPAQVTNTAAAVGGGSATHTATDPTTINPKPSLTISKHHAGNFTQGQQGTYTITVGDTGPTDGSTVTVKDLLPTGLSAAGIGGPGWTCDPGTVTCTRSDVLSAGQSYPDITLTVDVSPTAPAQVTNTATATGGGDSTTHTATDPTTVNPAPASPSLTISKTHTWHFTRGRRGIYTITVANSGNGPTNGSAVTVRDLLPWGLSAAGIGGPGWKCDLSTVTCTRSDVLSAGQSYPDITLTVRVSCRARHEVTNTATVTGGGDSTTHTATDPTTIKHNGHGERGEHCDSKHSPTDREEDLA